MDDRLTKAKQIKQCVKFSIVSCLQCVIIVSTESLPCVKLLNVDLATCVDLRRCSPSDIHSFSNVPVRLLSCKHVSTKRKLIQNANQKHLVSIAENSRVKRYVPDMNERISSRACEFLCTIVALLCCCIAAEKINLNSQT